MQQPDSSVGLAAAFSAFSFWGFLPLYFYAINDAVPVTGILVQRVIWATVLLGLFTLFTRRGGQLVAALQNRRQLAALVCSALLISINWGTFIWAVTHSHVLESSLGYYINPLLNIFLGFCFLQERLRRMQFVAVLIATIGVLIMVIGYGKIPWVSLILAGCFGGYGLIRKQVAVDSAVGLQVETLLLLPFALLWLGWLYVQGTAGFLRIDTATNLLLIGCGFITVVPLVLFAVGARRLRLGTIGLIQYITPTMQLLSGVLFMGEAFTRADAVTFGFIWAGLAIYTADTMYNQRRAHRGAAAV